MSVFKDRSPAWTYDVPIRPQELLSSWLCRSAHRHGFPAYRFLSWRLDGTPVLNRDFDLTGSGETFAEIDRMARLPAGSASNASLSSFAAAVAPDAAPRPDPAHVPFLLSAGVFHRTRRLHGLQACPACLAEADPYFPRWARFAFVTVCPVHRATLIDACPGCDAPIVPLRSLVRELGRCHSCLRTLAARGAEPAVPSAEAAAASDLQALCLAASAAPASSMSGLPGTGADVLRLSRVLVSICAALSPGGPSAGEAAKGRRQVERMRVCDRRRLLARAMGWMRDWPHRFHEQADRHGLTARAFVRRFIPEILALEVARLPAGGTRTRAGWRSLLEDPALRGLRGTDKATYRSRRAELLLAAVRS